LATATPYAQSETLTALKQKVPPPKERHLTNLEAESLSQ